jgi:predicted PurR-regulated permease PerM
MARQRAFADQTNANAWLAAHGVPLPIDITAPSSLDAVPQEIRAQIQSAALLPVVAVSGVAGALGSFGMMLLLSLFFLLGGQQLAEQVVQMFGKRAGGTDERQRLYCTTIVPRMPATACAGWLHTN